LVDPEINLQPKPQTKREDEKEEDDIYGKIEDNYENYADRNSDFVGKQITQGVVELTNNGEVTIPTHQEDGSLAIHYE